MIRPLAAVAGLAFLTSACTAPQHTQDRMSASPTTVPAASPSSPVGSALASGTANVPAESSVAAAPWPTGVLDAARLDPMVGAALSGPVVLSGKTGTPGSRWLLLSAQAAGDGLLVLMRENDGWKVADAGGVGVGCGVAPLEALADLGIPCG